MRRWALRRIRANILPFQILHWAALCPAGVVHYDDEGGAEVQDGVQRGPGGLHDQAGQHTRQTRQHQIHAKRVILFLKLDEDGKGAEKLKTRGEGQILCQYEFIVVLFFTGVPSIISY